VKCQRVDVKFKKCSSFRGGGGDSRPVNMGIGRVEMEAEHDQAADMGIGRVEMEAEHDQAAD
jgi:hypothetical protein